MLSNIKVNRKAFNYMEVCDGSNDHESVTPAVIATGESRFMQIGEPQRTILVEPLESPLPGRNHDAEPEPAVTPDPEPVKVPVR